MHTGIQADARQHAQNLATGFIGGDTFFEVFFTEFRPLQQSHVFQLAHIVGWCWQFGFNRFGNDEVDTGLDVHERSELPVGELKVKTALVQKRNGIQQGALVVQRLGR